ncbi:hypothetical protein Fot_37870 [Forsythia ovata]|uniref:Uncharacterized protein n=1 Tax=Forsythia ovata TaxID=205694 RepID=A0ABD1S0X1_9LAMI
MAREKRPRQEGARRVIGMWEILRGLSEARGLLLRGLRVTFAMIEGHLEHPLLILLAAPSAIAAASVLKYWTSAFVTVVDNAELMELLKLAEMYTSRSHVLNCELYKVLAMKVDELRSMVERGENIGALRSENKNLHVELAFFRKREDTGHI